MRVHVTLKDLLLRLELEERQKPAKERRAIPTITELAAAAGVSRIAMSNLVNDNRQRIDLVMLEGALKELTRRGFDVEADDLFAIREGKDRPINRALTGEGALATA